MIKAIIESNATRKKHVADMILKKNPKTVGIYRLIMKSNSDNFRASAIQSVIKHLNESNVKIIIFEPTIKEDKFENFDVIHDLNEFKKMSDVIVVNRIDNQLDDVKDILYTRDVFSRD